MKMLTKEFIVFLLLTTSVAVCLTNETKHEGKVNGITIMCYCNHNFLYYEELRKDIDQLKSDLQHLQNTTISLFKYYNERKNSKFNKIK